MEKFKDRVSILQIIRDLNLKVVYMPEDIDLLCRVRGC